MSQALYTFDKETSTILKKFRISSARSTKMEAQIYSINPTTYNILYEESDYPIDSIGALVEELPDNSPRFVVLSYPYQKDGRQLSPLVFVYWRPSTSKQEAKMLYAGCLELFKDHVSASKFIEIFDEDEFDELVDEIKK